MSLGWYKMNSGQFIVLHFTCSPGMVSELNSKTIDSWCHRSSINSQSIDSNILAEIDGATGFIGSKTKICNRRLSPNGKRFVFLFEFFVRWTLVGSWVLNNKLVSIDIETSRCRMTTTMMTRPPTPMGIGSWIIESYNSRTLWHKFPSHLSSGIKLQHTRVCHRAATDEEANIEYAKPVKEVSEHWTVSTTQCTQQMMTKSGTNNNNSAESVSESLVER